MGNTETKEQLTPQKLQEYRQMYNDMEKNVTETKYTNEHLKGLLTTSEQKASVMEKTIQNLRDENVSLKNKSKDLEDTVANLKKQLGNKPPDLDTIDEVAKIGNLYRELAKFQRRIEAALEATFAARSEHEAEIERRKKSNGEMFAKVSEGPVRARVLELSVELEEAEAHLKRQKADVRTEYRKAALKIEQLKEAMADATRKFGITVGNGTRELRRNLQSSREQLEAIEGEIRAGNGNTLIYEKVKNILLQQENLLVKETYSMKQGPSGDAVPQFLTKLNPTAFQKNTNIEADFARNVNIASPFSESDEEGLFDDTASEVGSTSSKTFKLFMHNVIETGRKSDEEKVRMVLQQLTSLDLSDIEVRRLRGPPGKPRPVLVFFNTFQYVDEILKCRSLLANTKFSDIKIYPYKKRPNPNTRAPNANKPYFSKPKGPPHYKRGFN